MSYYIHQGRNPPLNTTLYSQTQHSYSFLLSRILFSPFISFSYSSRKLNNSNSSIPYLSFSPILRSRPKCCHGPVSFYPPRSYFSHSPASQSPLSPSPGPRSNQAESQAGFPIHSEAQTRTSRAQHTHTVRTSPSILRIHTDIVS